MDGESLRAGLRDGARLGAAALLLSALAAGTPSRAADDGPPSQQVFERGFEGCTPDQEGCTYVRFEYPALDLPHPEGDRVVGRWMGAMLAEPPGGGPVAVQSLEEVAEAFFTDYAELRDDRPEAPPWTVERSIEVLHRSERVLSLAFTEYAYTGGAHPNERVRLVSFAPADGAMLGLPELVRPDARERLRVLGERAFREARGLAPDDDLAEAGFWFEGRFHLPDNLAVVPEGLRFRFDPYEVAPYVLGPSDFVIPREALAPLARPDGPLAAPERLQTSATSPKNQDSGGR